VGGYGRTALGAAVGNLVRGGRKLTQQKRGWREGKKKPALKMDLTLIPSTLIESLTCSAKINCHNTTSLVKYTASLRVMQYVTDSSC
jgi:hypothetical protein